MLELGRPQAMVNTHTDDQEGQESHPGFLGLQQDSHPGLDQNQDLKSSKLNCEDNVSVLYSIMMKKGTTDKLSVEERLESKQHHF